MDVFQRAALVVGTLSALVAPKFALASSVPAMPDTGVTPVTAPRFPGPVQDSNSSASVSIRVRDAYTGFGSTIVDAPVVEIGLSSIHGPLEFSFGVVEKTQGGVQESDAGVTYTKSAGPVELSVGAGAWAIHANEGGFTDFNVSGSASLHTRAANLRLGVAELLGGISSQSRPGTNIELSADRDICQIKAAGGEITARVNATIDQQFHFYGFSGTSNVDLGAGAAYVHGGSKLSCSVDYLDGLKSPNPSGWHFAAKLEKSLP